MKKKLLALILTLALLLPLIPAANVFAEGEKPDIYGTSLTLENNIAINFVVDAYKFGSDGFSKPRMTFTFHGAETTVSDYAMKNGYYYFTFHGITSKDMGDEVTAVLSGEKGGVRIDSEVCTQSVKDYCTSALSEYSDNITLRTMIVDLLTYGAKAQIYFDHDADALVTDGLTPTQLGWGTSGDPSPTSIRNTSFATVSNPEAAWRVSNLKLADSINLQLCLETSNPSALRVDVKNGSGTVLRSFYGEDLTAFGKYWRISLDSLTPDQMSDALYFTVYRSMGDIPVLEGELPVAGLGGEVAVSNTLQYSIESYVAEVIPQESNAKLTALMNAMLNYGASAAAYAAYAATAGPVSTPTTRAALEALPVASSSMTNNELRDLVVNFFEMQSSIPWVVKENIPYTYKGEEIEEEESANYTILANTIYCGMPYSNAGSSIYQFMDYYNEETGVLTQPYGSAIGATLGNHCCCAVYWAWSRVSTTINFPSTDYMTFDRGVLPVGDYVIDQTVDHFTADYNTKTVCTNNGSSVMYEAYAQLKKGDALVVFNKEGDTLVTHHAVLVKSVKTQTGAYSGGILGDSSTITLDDQSNSTQTATIGGQSATRFGRLDREVTFANLFNQGYIPVTCAELAGTATVQAAAVGLNSAVTGSVTLSKIGGKSVQTNYPMAKVTVSALDNRGNVVAGVYKHLNYRKKTCALQSLTDQLSDQLAAGTYTIRVDVLLSNGETKTAYTHSATVG